MRKLNFILIFIIALAPLSYAKNCFSSKQQQFTYEKGISPLQENNKITACLKGNIVSKDYKNFDKDVASLKKSGNVAVVLPQLLQVFRTSKSPQMTFTAAAALIAAPEAAAYEKQFFNVLTAQTEDYRRTLAAIILASMESIDSGYSPFLNPALEAQDPVLKAYACAAYTVIVPATLDRYLGEIITLYSFDKSFANKAFIASGLKDKALHSKLKEALKSQDDLMLLSAIEWIADLDDKKMLLSVLESSYNITDAAVLSTAASSLADNYSHISADLRKAMKKEPRSSQATVAVMAYSFLGSTSFNVLEDCLKSGNNNEKANALRVISSVAGILMDDPSFYRNPDLEKQRIRKLITPAGQVANNTKSDQVKTYADSALKELYKLINNK